MIGISLAFAKSSLCLVRFSSTHRDDPAQAVDGEVATPLVDDAWILVDISLYNMTLSVIKSRRTFVMDSSTAVSSSDIRA
jgi:hypothetical protein